MRVINTALKLAILALGIYVAITAPEPVGYMLLACAFIVVLCGTLEERANRKGK